MGINNKKDFFFIRAINEIPRIIACLDRNPLSETFGCFDINYWFLKKKKKPNLFHQFSILPLAIIYMLDDSRNEYYKSGNLLKWLKGAINYTLDNQNKDGSWDRATLADQFYNNTTPQLLYALSEIVLIMKDELEDELLFKMRKALEEGAELLSKRKVEVNSFAHHYAQRALAIWKVYKVNGKEEFEQKYHHAWIQFLTFHNHEEGWSKELLGFDPTAQTNSISAIAKIYKDSGDRQVEKVLKECIDFTSYFVYPDGFYGGSIGVLNFYDTSIYGFEVMSKQYSRAATIEKYIINGFLNENKTFSNSNSIGEIAFKCSEYLQAYLIATEEVVAKDHLPFESLPYTYYFKYADVYSCVKKNCFVIANLKKGGTLKIYDVKEKKLLHNDDGIIAMTNNKKMVCTNYIVNNYSLNPKKEYWEVEGKMIELDDRTWKIDRANKSTLSNKLSSILRKFFTIKEAPILFKRRFEIDSTRISVTDTFKLLDKKTKIVKLFNHIPFSYKSSFIKKHLEDKIDYLSVEEIKELNEKGVFVKTVEIKI